MNRRDSVFALLAMGAAGGPPGFAQGQPAREPFRIGLVPDSNGGWVVKGFREAMGELGRVEGRDYVLIRSGVFYGPDTQLALDRVLDKKPDLMLTGNLGYAVAAQKATQTIPVVMYVSGFPVEGGVAESLARPGKNVTGMTIYASGEFFGKLVQLVHEIKPSAKRIGVFMSYIPPFNPRAEADHIIRGLRGPAKPLGLDVRIFEIGNAEQLDAAMAAAVAQKVEALVLTSGVSIAPRMHDILQFALANGLPTIIDAPWDELGDPKPLLTYMASFGTLLRQAAPYVNQILWKGVKPGDLPIQLPARFEFLVNLKTAKALGITVPPSILVRADAVIE
jgi:putative ABC transport system substrate-binding protein